MALTLSCADTVEKEREKVNEEIKTEKNKLKLDQAEVLAARRHIEADRKRLIARQRRVREQELSLRTKVLK